jgi:hypothetical protein
MKMGAAGAMPAIEVPMDDCPLGECGPHLTTHSVKQHRRDCHMYRVWSS